MIFHTPNMLYRGAFLLGLSLSLLCNNVLASVQQLIRNGGFTGVVSSADWVLEGNFYADSRFSTYNSTPGYAYLSSSSGAGANSIWGTLSQTVAIPASASKVSFIFFYRISSVASSGNDVMAVVVKAPGGSRLKLLTTLYGQNANSTYDPVAVDVTEFRGQQVVFQFAATNDASGATVFRVDDVFLDATMPDDTTPPSMSQFYANPTSAQEGQSVQLNFTVADSGGSGLRQVTLWKNDYTNDKFDARWQQVDSKDVSGNGPVSDSFTSLPSVGSHWFGVHVLDSAGNLTDERDAGFSPVLVAITSAPPRVSLTLMTEPSAQAQFTVEPPPGPDGKYTAGTTLRVYILPAVDYGFLLWQGGASGTQIPLQLTLTSNTTVTAVLRRTDIHPGFSIIPTAQAGSIVATVPTRSTWCYIAQWSYDLRTWFFLKVFNGNDNQQSYSAPIVPSSSMVATRVEAMQINPSGLSLKMPLPANKEWLLNTAIGDIPCQKPVASHINDNYYSIDFGNWSRSNGIVRYETEVPVFAAAAGVVVESGFRSGNPANGYYVVIDHDYDTNLLTGYSTLYLHLTNPPCVMVNQVVRQGTRIGVMGMTGTDAVHLHFGVKYKNSGNNSNPEVKAALEKVRLEELTLDEYVTECNAYNRYYPSTIDERDCTGNYPLYGPSPIYTFGPNAHK